MAVGDINGDGFADLVAGGGPRVLVFSGKSLIDNQYTPLANFFGGDTASRGGIRVSVKNLDGDSKADLIVGSGAGSGGRATAYFGKTITTSGTPPVGFELESESSNNGIFVG